MGERESLCVCVNTLETKKCVCVRAMGPEKRER